MGAAAATVGAAAAEFAAAAGAGVTPAGSGRAATPRTTEKVTTMATIPTAPKSSSAVKGLANQLSENRLSGMTRIK